jgi:hypothetical protein
LLLVCLGRRERREQHFSMLINRFMLHDT